MDRNAFVRARSFLRYAPGAKWAAILSGVASSLLYVFLLVVLALFAELLVHRGRVPNFAQLPLSAQDDFVNRWKALPDADRVTALEHLGITPASANALQRLHLVDFQTLAGKEDFPPVPARMNREDLAHWAADRRVTGDPYFAAMAEHEYRWRGYVWLYLRDRVSASAADSFQPPVAPGDDPPLPALGTGNQEPHGVLGQVVRQHHSVGGRLLAWFAGWNPWMWSPARGIDPDQRYLIGLMAIALAVVLARVGCLLLMHRSAARATLEAITRLRRSLYHHSSRLGALGLRGRDPAEIQGLFTRHVEAVHDALYGWLTSAFRYPALFVLLVIAALLTDPPLAVISALFGLLVWVVGGQLAAALRRQGREASRRAATRLVLLHESVRMMRLVKAYLMERFNQSRVERQLADYARAHERRYRGEALARPILVLLGWMAAITLLYMAGRMVLADTVSVASLVVLMCALASLFLPIRAHFEQRRFLRRARESAALVFEFLERRPDVAQMVDAEFMPALEDRIEYRDVFLREPGSGRMLLDGVNLTVRAGQQIGIVGPDEDAKLALVYLLPRFIDPTNGEIRLDGRNLRYVTHDSLRSQIGLVLQHSLVFNDTVTNNIGCGDPSFTLPQIIEAAKLAHAHKFILNLPYGYETVIGELGHSLRLADRFRIALARAILRDPSILVIEEPTAPLDEDAKALLDDTLDRVVPGRTVIFLPHRVSTIRHCDTLFLLNNGVITASGTHRDLVEANELYRHLHYLEFNTFADTVPVG